jgi:hypothetical protein
MVGMESVSVVRIVRRQLLRRTIKVLAVATLVAMILAFSVSPALAAKARGGVLLKTTEPCNASSGAQNVPGSHLRTNVPDRAPGCWVLLPPNANPGD